MSRSRGDFSDAPPPSTSCLLLAHQTVKWVEIHMEHSQLIIVFLVVKVLINIDDATVVVAWQQSKKLYIGIIMLSISVTE